MGMIPINVENENKIIPKYEIQKLNLVACEPEQAITFTESSTECCVGIVDIVNSTRVTASLPHSKIGRYYSIFLNTMNLIVKRFGGVVIKNGGDSLLYYFPEKTVNIESAYRSCLECSLSMNEVHTEINAKLHEEKLPSLDYRVSADYGKITLAKSLNSTYEDIFGPAVNMCAKINSRAAPNTTVIGGDLYQIVKDSLHYDFHEIKGYSVGFKFEYPIYTVIRNDSQSRHLVNMAIEKSLREIGTAALDLTANRLFNEHNCFISDCYENPEHLIKILQEMFGRSHVTIVWTIKKNLANNVQQKPIRDFLERLGK